MPEWLRLEIRDDVDSAHFWTLVVRIGASLVLGWLVALAYNLTQGRREDYRPSFTVTLVMLTVTLCLITQVIGNSVARAFSLVGSLAVVRFRTPVNDTRDTAFVILSVAVGMAAGAGLFLTALVGVPAVGIVAAVMPRTRRTTDSVRHVLRVRIEPELDPEAAFHEVFTKSTTFHRCDGVESAKKGTALDLAYTVKLAPGAQVIDLTRALQQIAGVNSVEMHRV